MAAITVVPFKFNKPANWQGHNWNVVMYYMSLQYSDPIKKFYVSRHAVLGDSILDATINLTWDVVLFVFRQWIAEKMKNFIVDD